VQNEMANWPGIEGRQASHDRTGRVTVAEKVLIVDDEKEMLLVLKKAFESYRHLFELRLAHDGQEALDVLRESGDISLVVTDLIMPRMDGFSLLVNIRTDFPDVPVIIMTAHSRPVMERMAWKIGVAEYIEKPFDLGELARKIVANLGAGGGTNEGGIREMSVELFVQLIELEKKTCTLILKDNTSGKKGELHFKDGQLTDAGLEGFSRETAARELRTWKHAEISIRGDSAEDNPMSGSPS